MTDKKHHGHKEESGPSAVQDQGAAEGSAPAETEQPTTIQAESPDLEALRQKLADAEAKSSENLDGWQRAVAEFQNFKKRLERDRDVDQIMMKGDIIRKFLPILDDLERALQGRPKEDPWSEGIELIQRKLQSILEAEGLKRIEAEGEVFDPNYHEAISTEPVDGMESGRVVAVVQNGYTLGDRVIRPAQVRVAR
jgi:molecular chaperone GrpE